MDECTKVSMFDDNVVDNVEVNVYISIIKNGDNQMADIRYFADVDGETFAFKNVDHRGGKDNVWGWCVERNQWIKVTRKVQYKKFASKHICDARCMGATGRTMNCECSCGGKNHGKFGFTCE